MTDKNRIRRRVYDSDGDVLSIPIPRVETGGDPAFQEQMPHGLRMLLSARCLGHSPKFKKLANNKPFECRWTVFVSPSFRQMLEGLLFGAGPLLRQRGNRG
jgi:hypothetical protein